MNRQERRRREREQKRAATALTPGQLLDLGVMHQRAGRSAEAEAVYRELLKRIPGEVNACHLMGVIALERQDKSTAIEWFSRALRGKSDHAEAAILRGYCRLDAGQYGVAAADFARALAVRPDDVAAHNDMGGNHLAAGDADAALPHFAAAVAFRPDTLRYWRNLLLTYNLVPGDGMQQVAAATRWSALYAAPLKPSAPRHANQPDPERRLRVGYVGGTLFGFHTQSTMFLALLEGHDRAEVDLFCYSDLPEAQEDPITAGYRACSTWRRTGQLDDEALARAIRADGIDVLVDTVGFVEGSRLCALARRPAPVQTMLPPMMSLGTDVVDCLIADDQVLPPEMERQFSEPIERVPLIYRWRPLIEAPPARAEPRFGPIVFGSTNNLSKVGSHALRLWAGVLAAVPGSRLLIKGRALGDASSRAALIARAKQAGIPTERLDLRGWTPDLTEHLTVYHEIDVALDSVPYGGVTTTGDAMWMGVPVVTLEGNRVLGRYGAAMLRAAGLTEGIAVSEADYVAKAAAIAEDADLRAGLRTTLRERLAASRLCDAVGGARDLEQAYRRLWRRWCDRQGAQATASSG
ncbi:MAG: tetratricopeptide repeat protein [Alphaproteobacteria bacterium]|nr:tetratricopeptide repeat protein [Alphaproteobacteria bacterium]